MSKVKMQGDIQKWVDHSISVTVNVPESTPEEVIGDVYLTAWKSGCKGVTVYREGSRSGVLISNDAPSETTFEETTAPKRPKELEAKVIRFNNNDEKWVAVVGMLNDRPYEIFTGKLERSFQILSQLEKGIVVKTKNKDGSSRYDFKYEDEDGYNVTMEGLSRTFDKEYWNYAKLISGILRHGMPVKYVVAMVDDLHLSDDSLNTWKKGVIRALSKFIPNGTKPSDTKCTECGEESLVYEEGCLTCKSCGYSKCG